MTFNKQNIKNSEVPAFIYQDASARLNHASWSSYVGSVTSGGVCVFDANGDGREDLFFPGPGMADIEEKYFPNPKLGNMLFLNRGLDGDGAPMFEEVADKAGVRNMGKIGVGCASADYDNDGDEDLVVINGTRGVLFSAYGYLRSPISSSRLFPPPFFHTDGTDGKYNFPDEGGVTLFRNDGNNPPYFEDRTLGANLVRGGNGSSAAWADVDNDGFVDLFVANYSDFDFAGFTSTHFAGGFNVLWRNNGDGTFADVTEEAGVAGENEFVYTREGKKQYGWRPDFTDSKGRIAGDPAGNSLAAAFFDYNNDGLPDLVVADDIPGRIRIYKNLGNFRFQETSEENDFGQAGAWMGIAIGDVNNDGAQDVFATNLGGPIGSRHRGSATRDTYMLDILNPPNKATFYNGLWVYRNGKFRSMAKEVHVDWGRWKPNISLLVPEKKSEDARVRYAVKPKGLEAGEFGFGTAMIDFDNDGDQDLLWIGGLRRSGVLENDSKNMGNPGRFLENLDGGKSFKDVSGEVGVVNMIDRNDRASFQNGRGLAVGDFNDDGYYDIVMVNGGGWDSGAEDVPTIGGIGMQYRYVGVLKEYRPGPTFLYLSQGGVNNWIKVQLVGTKSNRSAIGARVIMEYEENGVQKKQVREIRAGESYASQHSLELIFGLGKAAKVDQLTIRWPSGNVQTVQGARANQKIIIQEK